MPRSQQAASEPHVPTEGAADLRAPTGTNGTPGNPAVLSLPHCVALHAPQEAEPAAAMPARTGATHGAVKDKQPRGFSPLHRQPFRPVHPFCCSPSPAGAPQPPAPGSWPGVGAACTPCLPQNPAQWHGEGQEPQLC